MDFRKQMADQISELASKLDKKQLVNARIQLGLSHITMAKYLNGTGSKIDVYQKLFDTLKTLS